MPAPAPQNVFPLLAHDYGSALVPHACVYELLPRQDRGAAGHREAANALVFIGGLGDGPHTVPAIRAVAARLHEGPDGSDGSSDCWSVFEVRLNSSFGQWGFASLRDDVREVGEVVSYLRDGLGKKRVVLMGHSTGCQVMNFLLSIVGGDGG